MINSAEDFCKAVNQFCPSVATLFQKSDVIISEPSDIEEAPIITGTLKIHKFIRCPPTATGEAQINFSFLSNNKRPCCTQKYTTKEDAGMISILSSNLEPHAYCMEKHMHANETQDWLRCPICMQWLHDAYFEQ